MKPIERKITVTLPESWETADTWTQRWLLQEALLRLVNDLFESQTFRGRTVMVTLHENGEHATAELVPLPPPEGVVPMDRVT